mmetsp:Transcript_21975/g.33347  ORF Transcript_21975/g.33347 Transcript_21975/m.33347 type:complete len:129 (+) Transcript_21975:833-1219(+)
MTVSCFERLEISTTSTEQDIKRAYRRLAIQTHPDKDPTEQKEQAAVFFRELHESYEEALELCAKAKDFSSGTATENPNRGRAKQRNKPTDADIKRTFNEVTDEMRRKRCIRVQENKDENCSEGGKGVA